ncbi:MAG: heme biosynthesis HemY N-terminal domain-containing protein [Gammaproteobacteria bacterium]
MRYLAYSLGAIAAGLLVAVVLGRDAGLVVIEFYGYVLRTSLAVFALMVIVVTVVAYLLVRLLAATFGLREAFARWSAARRRGRAERGLHGGLRALAGGDARAAERLLSRSARISDEPLLHYLGAARAAQMLVAPVRRDEYLAAAAEQAGEDDVAVDLTRADLLLASGETEAARAVLLTVAERAADNPQVLRLLAQVYRGAGDWEALGTLLVQAARRKALDPASLDALEREALQGILRAVRVSTPPADPEAAWARVPKRLRDAAPLLAEHARNLIAADRAADAELVLRRRLSNEWDPALAALYGHTGGSDSSAQLKAAEQWLRDRPEDPILLHTLGRLCFAAGLWGKARSYLEAALKRGADPSAYTLLVDTLTRIGDTDAARRYSLEGLRKASST